MNSVSNRDFLKQTEDMENIADEASTEDKAGVTDTRPEQDCHACKAPGSNLRCSGCKECKETYYCSKQCQRRDRQQHKRHCKEAQTEETDSGDQYTPDEVRVLAERRKRHDDRIQYLQNRGLNLFFHALTSEQMAVFERPPHGSLARAIRFVRMQMPGWKILQHFNEIAEEGDVIYWTTLHVKSVLVAFIFMYHDYASRHGMYLKDARDQITHVRFCLDVSPLPHFSYPDVCPGNYILIQNPRMHSFGDGTLGLRVFNPADVSICKFELDNENSADEASVAPKKEDKTSLADTRPEHDCHACNAHGSNLRCSRCKATNYCSKQCQRRDWQQHKRHCKEVLKIPTRLVFERRPDGSMERVVRFTRWQLPGWKIIRHFDEIPAEDDVQCWTTQHVKGVLVAFMFMYHDHAMRHGVYLKDARDQITHVEFYLDHVGDCPLPHFSYAQVRPGSYILLQNPKMHVFRDGAVGLRVNNPADVSIYDMRLADAYDNTIAKSNSLSTH